MRKEFILLLLTQLICFSSCKNDEVETATVIVTGDAYDIGSNSATISGYINLSFSDISNATFGIIWGMWEDNLSWENRLGEGISYDLSNNKFEVIAEELIPESKYYYRSFVLLNNVRIYGEVKSFITKEREKEDMENYSYPPTWLGFSLIPSSPHAGDSLMVTALQDKKGHLINATMYTWTLSCTLYKPDGSFEKYRQTETDKTDYDGLSNADPEHKFLVPVAASGKATISFRAIYNYKAKGAEVHYNDNYVIDIRSQSGMMSGGASGEVSFDIISADSN